MYGGAHTTNFSVISVMADSKISSFLETQTNPAQNQPAWQTDNWGYNSSPNFGVDGDLFNRTSTSAHAFAFYAVDLGIPVLIWNARLSLVQQG